MIVQKEDVLAIVDRFNMAITDEQANSSRLELLRMLQRRGGMKFYMMPEVVKIRFWKREDRLQKGSDMIAEEAIRCLECLESGVPVDYRPLFRLLDAYEKVRNFEL